MEDSETSSRNFQRVTKNDGLHIVEESDPSDAEKQAAHRVRAGDVGALATPGVMAHRKRKEKRTLDDGDSLD
jgi:hypothetical protein